MKDIKQWIKERDEAILSLDSKKIDAYSIKYCNGEGTLDKTDPLIYWAGVHKCVLAIRSSSQAQKDFSRQWLIAHHFNP